MSWRQETWRIDARIEQVWRKTAILTQEREVPKERINGGKDIGTPLSAGIYASSNPHRESLPLAYALATEYNNVTLPKTVAPGSEPSYKYPLPSSNADARRSFLSTKAKRCILLEHEPNPSQITRTARSTRKLRRISAGHGAALPPAELASETGIGNASKPGLPFRGRSVPYLIHSGLINAPSSFNEFSPFGQPLARPAPPYGRGLGNSPLNSSTNDVTNGEHTSLSGPPQLLTFPNAHHGGGQPQALEKHWKAAATGNYCLATRSFTEAAGETQPRVDCHYMLPDPKRVANSMALVDHMMSSRTRRCKPLVGRLHTGRQCLLSGNFRLKYNSAAPFDPL